ncbi:hypothetical protein H6P81_017257 [Aristolochia fimbriata]|uniref:Protein kinase domain-containing protein n=1 Tax=Aristolochia fimbriata TaxID=158543 RepID=A0AAV7DYL3_ARIFI|nr:hypothetical protein H6P81_017257 [Aristolochia fimbriata]
MRLIGSEIYEGCRTPSISSNFTASPPAPSLGGPSVSAREAYEGLCRTPDWSECSLRFTDAEDDEDDDFPSLIDVRNEFSRVSRDSVFTRSEDLVRFLPAPAEGPSFESADIARITNGFQGLIGGRGFGTIYRGKLIDKTEVSVKVFSEEICYKTELFSRYKLQIQRLTRIEHENLIRVIGYSFEGNKNAVVMELLPPGKLRTLADIHGEAKPLTWVQRFQIALDVAQALKYLHCDCNPPIIHGNVNIENIMLDKSLNARLADCGFSKAVYEEFPASSAISLTYLEPSFIINRYLNVECDVYDFGIVLWNLITDHVPWVIETSVSQNVRLFRWNRSYAPDDTTSLAYGPGLQATSSAESTSKAIKKAIKKATKIAEQCTHGNSRKRPTMTDVVNELKDCLRSLQSTSQILIDKRPGLPPKGGKAPQAR